MNFTEPECVLNIKTEPLDEVEMTDIKFNSGIWMKEELMIEDTVGDSFNDETFENSDFGTPVVKQEIVDVKIEANYECPDCHQTFTYELDFQIHKLCHEEENGSLACYKCHAKFSKKKHLIGHLKLYPHEEMECQDCKMRFYKVDSYEKHMALHKQKKIFKCAKCNRGFENRKALTRHSKEHECKTYKCGICEENFSFKASLMLHKLNHKSGKYFWCRECGRLFNSRIELKDHLPVHHQEKKFECSRCNCKFSCEDNYSAHLVRHEPPIIPKCLICGSTFENPELLSEHMKTHEDEN